MTCANNAVRSGEFDVKGGEVKEKQFSGLLLSFAPGLFDSTLVRRFFSEQFTIARALVPARLNG